jgi:hypothetical protein
MEDSTSETLQCQSRWDDEKYVRDHILDGYSLILDKYTMHYILNHIDCFLSQSRGTKASIKRCFIRIKSMAMMMTMRSGTK